MQQRVTAAVVDSLSGRKEPGLPPDAFRNFESAPIPDLDGRPVQPQTSSVFKQLGMLDQKLRARVTTLFVLSFAAFPLLVVHFELLFAYNMTPTIYSNIFSLLITVTTVAAEVALLLLYLTKHEMAVITHVMSASDNVLRSHLAQEFALEFVLLLLHVPPWVNFTIPSIDVSYPPVAMTYTADVLQLVLIVRLYQIPRLLHVHSRLGSDTGRWLRSVAFLDVNKSLTLRVYLHAYPFRVLAVVFAIALPLLSYTHRVCHWTYIDAPGKLTQKYLVNSLWLTVTSMTTLAFGEVFPATQCSRFFVWVGTACGITLTSLLIVTVVTQLSPSQSQLIALSTISKAEKRRSFFTAAALVIQRWWRSEKVLRAFQSSSFAVSRAHAALAEAIAVFRQEKRSLIQVNHQTYEQLSTLKIPAAVSRLTRETQALQQRVAQYQRTRIGQLDSVPGVRRKSSVAEPTRTSTHRPRQDRIARLEVLVQQVATLASSADRDRGSRSLLGPSQGHARRLAPVTQLQRSSSHTTPR